MLQMTAAWLKTRWHAVQNNSFESSSSPQSENKRSWGLTHDWVRCWGEANGGRTCPDVIVIFLKWWVNDLDVMIKMYSQSKIQFVPSATSPPSTVFTWWLKTTVLYVGAHVHISSGVHQVLCVLWELETTKLSCVLIGCAHLPTERQSFPVCAETETKQPTEVPPRAGGWGPGPAQLLCLLQGGPYQPPVSV